ncbi:type II secretion system F family protein [Alteromonas sp. ASW11-19]|uniref:Type II secretion system F family protein n=1 Tax=Alteromonas salexigens TaxID=2982530 RepID=A0ABT2VNJ0_9ALTE|nr:type II secretion system F family protein [Alteromonas salexigens]MCU7554868.1 type II secretion system F family protein [Alteromonas salexigens]
MDIQLVFLVLVFLAVVMLSQLLFVSVNSPQRADTKELKKQLDTLISADQYFPKQLLLNSRLNNLSALRKSIEELPWVSDFTFKLELSGSKMLGHEYLAIAGIISTFLSVLLWLVTRDILVSGVCWLATLAAFHFKLQRDIAKRMDRIEEQFPEALDVLKRGLQAGYAFNEALKLVFEELKGDLSDELKLLFQRINLGADLKTAMLAFVRRVPSTSAMAFSSAVNIQKETGGNLAENIENLSVLIRQRFKFRRKVKTLSAEGRLSGWILVLLPFALFALLYLTTPTYVSELFTTEEGHELLKWGLIGMLVGTIWIKKLLELEA